MGRTSSAIGQAAGDLGSAAANFGIGFFRFLRGALSLARLSVLYPAKKLPELFRYGKKFGRALGPAVLQAWRTKSWKALATKELGDASIDAGLLYNIHHLEEMFGEKLKEGALFGFTEMARDFRNIGASCLWH